MEPSGSSAARFHLRDGRPLVFYTIPRSVFRRRAGEFLLGVMLVAMGLVAATLLAKGRPEPARLPKPASSRASAAVR